VFNLTISPANADYLLFYFYDLFLFFVVDIYEEFFNPATAAQTLLHSAVAKRKEFLQKTMSFVMSILTATNLDPRQKSGALHMIGSLSDVLLVVSSLYFTKIIRLLEFQILF